MKCKLAVLALVVIFLLIGCDLTGNGLVFRNRSSYAVAVVIIWAWSPQEDFSIRPGADYKTTRRADPYEFYRVPDVVTVTKESDNVWVFQ